MIQKCYSQVYTPKMGTYVQLRMFMVAIFYNSYLIEGPHWKQIKSLSPVDEFVDYSYSRILYSNGN